MYSTKSFSQIFKRSFLFLILIGSFYTMKAQNGGLVTGTKNLDFASASNGIILPIVETLPAASTSQNGTFLLDKNDKKLKMCENNSWIDLCDKNSIANSLNSTTETDAIIGETSTSTGVLALEATDNAMILPHVAAPETSVKNPVAGMLVYDTASNSLALFDGLKWNYWK
jgi:hypothetical protein